MATCHRALQVDCSELKPHSHTECTRAAAVAYRPIGNTSIAYDHPQPRAIGDVGTRVYPASDLATGALPLQPCERHVPISATLKGRVLNNSRIPELLKRYRRLTANSSTSQNKCMALSVQFGRFHRRRAREAGSGTGEIQPHYAWLGRHRTRNLFHVLRGVPQQTVRFLSFKTHEVTSLFTLEKQVQWAFPR